MARLPWSLPSPSRLWLSSSLYEVPIILFCESLILHRPFQLPGTHFLFLHLIPFTPPIPLSRTKCDITTYQAHHDPYNGQNCRKLALPVLPRMWSGQNSYSFPEAVGFGANHSGETFGRACKLVPDTNIHQRTQGRMLTEALSELLL